MRYSFLSKKQLIIFALLIGVLTLLCSTAVIAIGLFTFNTANPAGPISEPLPTVTPTPVPRIERTPVASPILPTISPSVQPSKSAPEETGETKEKGSEGGQASPLQLSTEQMLLQTTIPERDQRLLAMRLKHNGQEIPITQTAQAFQLGDTDIFWVTDNQQTPPRQFRVTASLKYITPHAYWWVQDEFNVNEEALKRSAGQFENNTYPTNRAFFGSEWSPGVDKDIHVHIFMGDVPGVAGYFSASNEYSTLAEPYSNEREMFFINLKAISPGNDYFDGILAHEFQHMIHWHQDRNEDTWVNEGLSELATFINGYGTSSFVGAFTSTPDTQLTTWADTPGTALANYGGSFLFMAYFLQRYGKEMTQAVVANPKNGIAGFDAVLSEHNRPERFNDIFADFLVANYLNDSEAGPGLWGYSNLSSNNQVTLSERYSVYPQKKRATVYQYGSDYIELTGHSDITVQFTGSTQVKVIDNDAHSGSYQWYSHRGDDSNSRLTRAFDLRNVNSATLNYWTWYDIEANWDYGYVEISTDGGQTWTILQTEHSATDNPSGNAYGPGYTGFSGAEKPVWIEESIDISAYAGQETLIRFEYVTDDAVNHPGWSVDDISIPEINFYDDIEGGPNGWQAEGFVRIDNILPQRFLVQILEIGDEVKVKPVPLDQANSGTLTITGLGSTVDQALLIISGLTPITTQPASYEYKITGAE
jgi:hypothetical protein